MRVLRVFSVFVLCSLAAGEAVAVAPIPSIVPIPNDPEDRLEIQLGSGVSLEAFLCDVSRETGKTLLLGKRVASNLESGRAWPIKMTLSMRVPRSELFSALTAILRANEYLLVEIAQPAGELLVLEDVSRLLRERLGRIGCRSVAVDELLSDPKWRFRREVVLTVVPLRHLGAREARVELALRGGDEAVEGVFPVDALGDLILRDSASKVVHVVNLIHRLDRERGGEEGAEDSLRSESGYQDWPGGDE